MILLVSTASETLVADADANRAIAIQKGDIVGTHPEATPAPPDRVLVSVNLLALEVAVRLAGPWPMLPAWETVAEDNSVPEVDFRVTNRYSLRGDGAGAPPRSWVEPLALEWGASFTQQDATGPRLAYDEQATVGTLRFRDGLAPDATVTRTAYSEAEGRATYELDLGAWEPTAAEEKRLLRAVGRASHITPTLTAGVVEFGVVRDDLFRAVVERVLAGVPDVYQLHRFAISETLVDQIVTGGGAVAWSIAQLDGNVADRTIAAP